VIVTPVMLSVALPLLVSVTLCAALELPTSCDANVRLVGAKVTAGAGAATAVPDKGMVCGLPLALSAMDTEAVRAPLAVGLKVTLMAQVALVASVAAQVLVSL